MGMQFGIESSRPHHHTDPQPPARFLVLIDSADGKLARLFLESRVAVAEFDAGAEEVNQMTRELMPSGSASGAEWDRALGGHTAQERREAEVYTLGI